MMLTWLGERRETPQLVKAGHSITDAIDKVISDPSTRTRDLGGSVNTDAFGHLVAEVVANAVTTA